MVKVFFETPNGSYAEEVATFSDESLYIACRPILASQARNDDMIVTETIIEDEEG